ncbi:MAG TPA: BamA/TamA family outer membrane protein, partial [Agriterribacter sp.]|nr:BamA/TamA family outer membrane protein [Agriterribacter sp.]
VAAGKTIIYDLTLEQNQFLGKDNSLERLSPNAAVNDLNRTAYKYDIAAPFIAAAYNIDDGVYLGAAVKYTTHAFRKEPFSVQQRLSIAHSLETKAYNFRYALEGIDVIRNIDLVLLADIRAPNNTINFFRYGNETVFDRSDGKNILYYRTRFSLADFVVLTRFNIASNTTLSLGPFFQRFAMNEKDNKSRLITTPFLNGLDSISLFKQKNFAGLQVSTIVDNRNSAIIPSRGILWQTTMRVNRGFGSFSRNCTQLNTDLALYFSFNTQANLVIATRFGGGINFGDYEFFQAQYLSGTENLRGYRKYRFAGDKAAFNNTELRIKLADFRTYLLPGNLGIILFHDIGRVWVKGENSSTWHTGYGGGFWVSPLRRFVGTACYGFSKDGGLPFVSLGFQF